MIMGNRLLFALAFLLLGSSVYSVPAQQRRALCISESGEPSVRDSLWRFPSPFSESCRRPAAGMPLSLNMEAVSDTRLNLDLASSLLPSAAWSTVILGSAYGNIRTFDRNGDGYEDAPGQLCFKLSNRWEYAPDGGPKISFGFNAFQDRSSGGQTGYDHTAYEDMMRKHDWTLDLPWGWNMTDRSVNGYLRFGIPLSSDGGSDLDIMSDYTYSGVDSRAGGTKYEHGRNSGRLSLKYNNYIVGRHRLSAGVDGFYDGYDEYFFRLLTLCSQGFENTPVRKRLYGAGVSGEYGYTAGDFLTLSAGLRAGWYGYVENGGPEFRISPVFAAEYSPSENIIFRLDGCRRLMYSDPLLDNMYVMYTGKMFMGDYTSSVLEDVWNIGGMLDFRMPKLLEGASLSIFYRRKQFAQQVVADYEYGASMGNVNSIWFYSLDGRRSFSDIWQADLKISPLEGLSVEATFLYNDSRTQFKGKDYPVETPLENRYRGILNLRYATRGDKWIFDFSTVLNGPCRVYDFMADAVDSSGNPLYRDGKTPVYPLVSCQVTRRLGWFDIYIGSENLTDFRQKTVVLGSVKDGNGVVSGRQPSFDASAVWGPVTGVRIYAGVAFALGRD